MLDLVGMKKYWTFFKNYLSAGFEYRGAFVVWILSEVLSVASLLFLWFAVFRSQDSVGGYNLSSFVSYYLIVPLIGSLTQTFVSDRLPKRIKDGEISRDLLKPYSLSAALFIEHLGVKMNQLLLKTPLFLILYYLIVSRLGYSLSVSHIVLGMLLALLGFVIIFFLDLVISFTSFWMSDVWALTHLKRVSLFVLGGMTFPLDLLPERVYVIVGWLPFKFAYYFPTKVVLGQVGASEIAFGIFQLAVWALGLLALSKLLFTLGIKKYSAYGG